MEERGEEKRMGEKGGEDRRSVYFKITATLNMNSTWCLFTNSAAYTRAQKTSDAHRRNSEHVNNLHDGRVKLLQTSYVLTLHKQKVYPRCQSSPEMKSGFMNRNQQQQQLLQTC